MRYAIVEWIDSALIREDQIQEHEITRLGYSHCHSAGILIRLDKDIVALALDCFIDEPENEYRMVVTIPIVSVVRMHVIDNIPEKWNRE